MQLTNLKTDFIGRKFIFYPQIDSTQKEIWRLIQAKKIDNGTVLMADIQTNAQGTHGRIWHTDEKDNIACSFYIKTNCSIENIQNITIDIAKIIVEIFQEEYNIRLEIKKPNDITLQHKKIGGILTESRIYAKNVKFLVIGIGINTVKMNFTEDIKGLATSIKKEFGIEVNRIKIISNFCNKLEELIKRREMV